MILLDTHAWLWWVDGSRSLSRAGRRRIDEAAAHGVVHVSAISAWEVAMLVRKGRLRLAVDVGDWIARSRALPVLQFVPVSVEIAVRAVQLPEPLHDDPADRIIVATALQLGVALLTRDVRLRRYRAVRTVW